MLLIAWDTRFPSPDDRHGMAALHQAARDPVLPRMELGSARDDDGRALRDDR